MKSKTFTRFLPPIVLLLAVILLFQAAAAQGQPLPSRQASLAPDAPGDFSIVLNEVMPKEAASGGEWVELYVEQEMATIFLPVIISSSGHLEAAPQASAPAAPAALATIDPSGWTLSNADGASYTLPEAVPALPRGTYILVSFDGAGAGADDYDPSDGLISLHTPPAQVDVFPDQAGQVALYDGAPGPATIRDFLAWGGFDPAAGADAVQAGIWGSGQAASFENGFGDISLEDLTEPDESMGRYPGAPDFGVGAWANYPSSALSPGGANPVQPSTFITPEDGAVVEASSLSLSWKPAAGAGGYLFQLDDTPDFSSPLISVNTNDPYYMPQPALAPGDYVWRVAPIRSGVMYEFSGPFSIGVIASTSLESLNATVEKVLAIDRVRQNKDSYLLGLGGAPEGDPTTNTPENAWDSPAPCTEPPCVDNTKFAHGSSYCVRASIRMVASWYHANAGDILSMDRISYYVLQEWSGNTNPGTNDSDPSNDLGFSRGMYYPDEEDEGFSWALNISYTTPGGKPTFANIKTWIEADRPIMFRNPGHMMVINGYRETDGGDQLIHVLDPDQPPNFERWQDYDTQTISGYWVGPTGGPANGASRTDETSVWTDSDNDGIMNFDEVTRFFTDPYDADTDEDWVNDKQDMREYVFDAFGNYNYRNPDMDGDSLRKELDPDNDADGTPEGCEDTNYNGIYEAGMGETNNFSAASSQACAPLFDILYPLQTEPVNAGDPSAPDKILVQVSTAVPEGWPLTLVAGDFSVEIGGNAASVVSVYPSADTYFLVVDPPTQASAAFYDLSVALSGSGTDSETNAVFYLPKSPNDEVIVLDRSGSMLSDDKIGAAKNAASAFIDFLNDDDAIGVTSFASSASTDFPLTTITGATVRTNAIAAVDALSATGSTALGQGMQQGYGLLTASGDPAHDWSMVLLSDGWENVAPYWSSIAGSITDAVVHTVALGEDADTGLLQSIAGAKHGNYFYVDVNPPSAAVEGAGLAPLAPPVNIASTLPNRLADAYVSIGELTHGYQRLDNRIGLIGDQPSVVFEVLVDKGLPEAIFSLNWDDPFGYLELILTDPDGGSPVPLHEFRDDTHHQLHIKDPKPGMWVVNIRNLKPTAEYNFMLSGKNDTTLIAAVGGDPAKRSPGVPVPIYGVLTDRKPIAGADVFALVAGPGLPKQPGAESISGTAYLQLFDDGAHGDGKADDGLYANTLLGTDAPGGYTVKLTASGVNNDGEPFVRYASTGFNVLRRIAYVWKDAVDLSLSYEVLLRDAGFVVDMVQIDDAPKHDFTPYNLVLIGPETGNLEEWGTPDAVTAIITSEVPVLGLGEGGYAFFGKSQAFIGYPHGAHGSGAAIDWANASDPIWSTPYNIELLKEPLKLYETNSTRVDIFLEGAPLGVNVFGFNDNDARYANLVMENEFFMLWGFDLGPDDMSESGQRLFINTVVRTLH